MKALKNDMPKYGVIYRRYGNLLYAAEITSWPFEERNKLFGKRFYNTMDATLSRYLVFDVPCAQKKRHFAKRLYRSPFVVKAWLDRKPIAVAWVDEIHRGEKSGNFHMFFDKIDRGLAYHLAENFLPVFARKYQCLYSIFPACFYHVAHFARHFGFEKKADLPGFCRMGDKFLNGVLYAFYS